VSERTSHDAAHARFDEGEFWRTISSYSGLSAETFLDPEWQGRHSVRSIEDLAAVVGQDLTPEIEADARAALARAPMSVRLTPYIVALIDWRSPRSDPLRRQFLPLGSEQEPDHPAARLDSLAEQSHSPVPGLIRRYPDRVLFMPLTSCPVYCAFCTRSYAVGLDTRALKKQSLAPARERWDRAFEWLGEHPEIEDVVISGGDAFNLKARELRYIGERLLAFPAIRRIRVATRGLAVLPSRIAAADPWTAVLVDLVRRGRDRLVSVALHTHFNHPREITWVTRDAAALLFREGVTIRNQSVLLRGVNDDLETMSLLLRRLSAIQIQPYYVYQSDITPGTEAFRTPLQTAIALEVALRGRSAGFNMPSFVVDLPDGGGKRHVHSFVHYDCSSGVSVFRSPAIGRDRDYFYYDPRMPGGAI
jgi:lysine 2,3-aminomutase